MTTLDELTAEEDRLSRIIEGASGQIEDRDHYLEEHGVYDAYAIVYQRYVALALRGDVEALKRAIFLQWYAVAEPYWLSGIPDPANLPMRSMLAVANEQITQGSLDIELQWMLPYYFMILEWYVSANYIGPVDEFTILINFSRENQRHPSDLILDADTFRGRGAMGDYWVSIAESKTSR